MTRPSAPLLLYILSAFFCFAMAGSACAQLKSEGRDARTAVVNCTSQELGTTPGLTLATLVAVANVVAAERVRCLRDDTLNYDCIEADLIGEGEILGGCAFAHLIASAPAPAPLAAPDSPEPWRVQFERFRTNVGKGAKYHLADGNY